MRTYTDAEKAEAIALAASLGPLKAARQLGIPPRNVARWMHTPAATPIRAAVELTMAQRMADAHDVALTKLRARLDDPSTKTRDLVDAVRVLGEQRALAEGRATSNVASMSLVAELSPEERDEAASILRGIVEAQQAGETMEQLAAGIIPDKPGIFSLISVIERAIAERADD